MISRAHIALSAHQHHSVTHDLPLRNVLRALFIHSSNGGRHLLGPVTFCLRIGGFSSLASSGQQMTDELPFGNEGTDNALMYRDHAFF